MTIALFTALGYLVAAGFSLPAVHFLGPRYTTHTTARPAIIAFGVFHTLALFFRAVTCRNEMKRTYGVAVLIGGGLALADVVLVVLSSPVAA